MNLTKIGQVKMAIDGFLSNQKVQTYDVVRPVVQLGKYKHKITAIVKDDLKTTIKTKVLKM